jgi:hypothetical protein
MQLPDRETKSPRRAENLESLRKFWLEALADDSPGIPAEEVFLRLERKYKIAVGQG